MKQKLQILASLLLALPVFLPAQSNRLYSLSGSVNYNEWPTVRAVDTTWHLTYCRSSVAGESCFTYVKNDGTSAKKIAWPDSLHIRDFQVVDGVVYFCGDNSASGVGIMGRMTIDTIMRPHAGVNYVEVENTRYLHRLVAYPHCLPSSNRVWLAAIGRGDSTYENVDVLVRCDNAQNTIGYYKIRRMHGDAANGYERLEDIAVSLGRIVMAGYYEGVTPVCVSMRRSQAWQMTSSELDTLYYYPDVTNAYDIHLTGGPGDTVALTYRSAKTSSSTSKKYYSAVRFFKSGTMNNVSSWEIMKAKKNSLQDVVYLYGVRSLVMMDEEPERGLYFIAVPILPSVPPTTTLTLPLLYKGSVSCQSLSAVGGTHLVAAGALPQWIYIQQLTTQGCLQPGITKISAVASSSKVTLYVPRTSPGLSTETRSFFCVITQGIVNVNCEDE